MKFYNCHIISLLLLIFSWPAQAQQKEKLPFRNAKLPTETRVNDLVKRLSTDEKIGLLYETSLPIDRLGIEKYYYGNEGLHGVMRGGKFTVFPQSIALAATWDTALMHSVATAISDEARGRWNELDRGRKQTAYYSDLLTMWSPTINMARDPRWGRTAETYGEDPYLTSRLAVAYIKGLQGDDKKYIKVAATPKHFAANNEENNRLAANAVISEKTLREYYLPAFKSSIVEARAQSLMTAYNKVNGVPSTANRWLLTDVLRKEWGFDGFVVSDCGAAYNVFATHHYVGSYEEAAAAVVKAGLDLECSGGCKGCSLLRNYLKGALQNKLITVADLDQSVKNILRVRFRLGLFDKDEFNPYDSISGSVVGSARHQQLALEAAQKSIVLLKNSRLPGQEKNILPLDLNKIKSIAIVGHNANTDVFGGYSGQPFNKPVTPLDGIKKRVGNAATINFVPAGLNNYALEMIPAEALVSVDGTNGLNAAYFSNRNLEGEAKTRIDAQVNLNFKDNPPDPFFAAGEKSVRWTGWFTPPVSGEYVLGVSSDDGARMWFDDEQKINSWVKRGEIIDTFKVVLEAGKKYPVKIEYFDVGGDAVCRFWWRAPFSKSVAYVAQQEAAKKSDVVVAIIGTGLYNEREGYDKLNLELPGDQLAMLKAVYAVNKNIVVVMVTGSQHSIDWIKDSIPGIVNVYYAGEQAGTAIAAVLFGDYNPSGRLPLTYYENLSKVPAMDRYEITEGRTYMYYDGKPLYAFGYGLSYSSFSYQHLKITPVKKSGKTIYAISVDIKNESAVDGEEVVQLYASYPGAKTVKPIKQLKKFARVAIAKGETKNVNFSVDEEDFRFWDEKTKNWQTETGGIMINIGASSDDIRLSSLLRQ